MRKGKTRFLLTKDDKLFRLVREYKTKCICMNGEIQVDVPTDDVVRVYEDFASMRDDYKARHAERE